MALSAKSPSADQGPTAWDTAFRLRLLATSDLHVHLTPWDYYTDRHSAIAGLARTGNGLAKGHYKKKK